MNLWLCFWPGLRVYPSNKHKSLIRDQKTLKEYIFYYTGKAPTLGKAHIPQWAYNYIFVSFKACWKNTTIRCQIKLKETLSRFCKDRCFPLNHTTCSRKIKMIFINWRDMGESSCWNFFVLIRVWCDDASVWHK